jgi:hypothetical protein
VTTIGAPRLLGAYATSSVKVTEALHQNEQTVPSQQTPQMQAVAVDPTT